MVCRRIKPISNAALRTLWLDPQERMASMAAKAGCSYDTLAKRAKALGLPKRPEITAKPRFRRDDLFRAMWRAGVSAYCIARHFGVRQSSVSRAAASFPDLVPRKAGQQPQMTLTDFLETLLAARLMADRIAELRRPRDPAARAVPVDLEALFPGGGATVTGRKWRALFEAGLTAPEAAARRGVTVKAAENWAKRNGFVWPRVPEVKAEVAPGLARSHVDSEAMVSNAQWAHLHARGLTAAEAAAVRGRTAEAARWWARQAGATWPRAGVQDRHPGASGSCPLGGALDRSGDRMHSPTPAAPGSQMQGAA